MIKLWCKVMINSILLIGSNIALLLTVKNLTSMNFYGAINNVLACI